MKKKLVIAGSGIAFAALLGSIAFFVLSDGGIDEILPVVEQVPEVEREPIVVLERPEQEPLEIFGPACFNDTRGNDTLTASSPDAQVDCFVFSQGGNDLIDMSARDVDQPVLIAINGTSPARQTIRLGPANDFIEMRGDYSATIEGRPGQNSVLSLSETSPSDIEFRQNGSNVILSAQRGEITLVRQAAGDGSQGAISHILLRDGIVLQRSQIRVQSTVGQGNPDNDNIRTTDNYDIIYPGLGNDRITLLGGRNNIHFEGGNDTINSVGVEGAVNTLFIESRREEVSFSVENRGRDVVITTPEGTVTLQLQYFYDVGDQRVPFSSIVFSDGPVTDEELRFLIEVQEEERNAGQNDDRMRIRQ